MGIVTWFQENILSNTLMIVFLIAVIGYLVGSIKICGIELGTAGILLVALVFGHFGFEIPDLVRELGLICFVTSVGFIAGPKFFRNFKLNATSYILLGVIIIAAGALTCVGVITLLGVPDDISVGMMAGALTSTPGLAAALDATGSEAASVGYGIAYPFGVVGVVLFVQLIPKLLKTDMAAERAKFEAASNVGEEEFKKTKKEELFYADSMGAVFSLGTSGGPLIAGLILGHFGKIGKLSVKVEKHVLECLREFGLALFLIGAGVQAGAGFVEILKEQGLLLFVYGALMTLIPMLLGYVFASKVLKLSLFNTLGSICGGMTSTPALGTLIRVTETDDVASAYAATYPVALVFVVLACQFIGIFL